MAGLLIDTAEKALPCVQPRWKMKWRDDIFSHLCVQNWQARAAWRDAECHAEGPLSEKKNKLRRTVKKNSVVCAARSERFVSAE